MGRITPDPEKQILRGGAGGGGGQGHGLVDNKNDIPKEPDTRNW